MQGNDPRRPAGVREGEILAGKFRVERVLGQGGMGVVVAAYHLQLDEKVALKFLLPEALGNAEAVARFVREARAAVKIKSEHVARVSDVGTLESGAPYIVMEYLDGEDLSAWLKQRGPLPVEQAIEFVLQASMAIAEAHSLGIVHRDLKPANLFCVRRADGQLSVKVLDFGISKLIDGARASEPPGMSVLTKPAVAMGSPHYMSPEQVQNAKDVDARTDLWALGVILFELLTGKPPFEGEGFGELAVKIVIQPPVALRGYRPDVPPALEAVVLRCMEKDRARRYPNIAELALALLPFAPRRAKTLVERIGGIIQAAGLSESALAVPASPEVPGTLVSGNDDAPIQGSVAPWSGSPGAAATSRKRVTAGVTAAFVLLVGGGVVLHWSSSGPAATASVTTSPPSPPSSSPQPVASTDTTATATKTPEPLPPIPTDSTATPAPPPLSKHNSDSKNGQSFPTPTSPVRPPSPMGSATAAHPVPSPPDCQFPYTLDDQGKKKFRPECYLSPKP